MTTQAEKLQSGIDSLNYRIAALAERLPNESSSKGDTPRDTARQINEYGRTLAILTKLKSELAVGDAVTVTPVVKPAPNVYSYWPHEAADWTPRNA